MTTDDNESGKPARERSLTWLAAPALLAGLGLWIVGQTSGVDAVEDAKRGANPAPGVADSSGFSPEQRRGIEAIVRDYLVKNPEIMLEVQQALEAKVEKEQAEKTRSLISQYSKELYRHPGAAVAGNPEGDITVVEFFDYNCGYCKRGLKDIAKLIESDKNVRVVFKEYPILRDESEQAAHVALAAGKQGKYWPVHQKLLATKGLVNEAVALKAAEEAGADMAKIKADMNSPEVKGEIERVKELAGKMGINGTPHFLVGDRSIGGAPDNLYDLLTGHVAALRKDGCTYC